MPRARGSSAPVLRNGERADRFAAGKLVRRSGGRRFPDQGLGDKLRMDLGEPGLPAVPVRIRQARVPRHRERREEVGPARVRSAVGPGCRDPDPQAPSQPAVDTPRLSRFRADRDGNVDREQERLAGRQRRDFARQGRKIADPLDGRDGSVRVQDDDRSGAGARIELAEFDPENAHRARLWRSS
jgi:hypothetical protein